MWQNPRYAGLCLIDNLSEEKLPDSEHLEPPSHQVTWQMSKGIKQKEGTLEPTLALLPPQKLLSSPL